MTPASVLRSSAFILTVEPWHATQFAWKMGSTSDSKLTGFFDWPRANTLLAARIRMARCRQFRFGRHSSERITASVIVPRAHTRYQALGQAWHQKEQHAIDYTGVP